MFIWPKGVIFGASENVIIRPKVMIEVGGGGVLESLEVHNVVSYFLGIEKYENSTNWRSLTTLSKIVSR